MFPPLHRFWPSYLVTIITFIALFCLGHKIFTAKPDSDPALPIDYVSDPTVLIVYVGVWIAFISILSSSWSHWRSSSVQHAMSALQTLRTDREYLINAFVLKVELPDFGQPLNDEMYQRFLDTSEPSSIDQPSFSDASRFVLNQYEFLAAAARQGAVDQELLKETIKSVLSGLVHTYQPAIIVLRKKNKNTYRNLIWLYRKQTGDSALDLGP